MGRTGVTENQIFEACRKITGRKENVTALKIRNELGSGSMTTITDGLRAWKVQVKPTTNPVKSLPDELLVVGNQATKTIWETAKRETETEITLIRETYDKSFKEKEDELKDILILSEKQDTEVESLKEKVTKLNQDFNQAKAENIRKIEQIRTQQEDSKKLQSEFANLKQGYDKITITNAKLEQNITNLAEQLNSQKKAIEQKDNSYLLLKQKHDEIIIIKTQLEQKNNNLTEQLQAQHTTIEQQKDTHLKLKQELDTITICKAKLEEKTVNLSEQLKSQQKAIEQKDNSYLKLKNEYDKIMIANAQLEQKKGGKNLKK